METVQQKLSDLVDPTLFKALGDPTRARLFIECACSDDSCGSNVSKLATCCSVDMSVVSRHLKQLLDSGLVESNKQGREVYYRIPAEQLAARLRGLADALESCACEVA